MNKRYGLLVALSIVCLVASCGEDQVTSSSSMINSTPITSSSSSSYNSSSSINYKTNEDFEKAKTTYIENGEEKDLNMQTLFRNQNSPHLDPLEKQNILVVPFGFNDKNLKENIQTQENIDRINTCFFGTKEAMEEKGGWYSVVDYYKTSSFNKAQISGDVVNTWCEYNGSSSEFLTASRSSGAGVYAASYVKTWYEKEYNKENHGSLGEDAKPLTYYDQNNDGFIDLIWIVYSVPYSTDQSQDWWAYVTYTNEIANLKSPSIKTLGWASINFLNDSFNGYDTHTFIHETGHTFGLDDYYDYTNSWSPMGAIDMMDNNIGDHCAFSKFTLGWLSPLVVDDSAIITLRPTSTTGDCFIIPSPNYNGTAFDEYFMIEYMSPVGLSEYDYTYGYKSLSGYSKKGIRISHIDARTVSGASTKAENYVSEPQKATDFRVSNSKGGRSGDGSDGNFFPVNGENNSYALTMIMESNPDRNDNVTTSKGANASNSLFTASSRFFLDSRNGRENTWSSIYMPSRSNLWNKAKTMTGGTIKNQKYTVDESCTFDYEINVLSIAEEQAQVRVTKLVK